MANDSQCHLEDENPNFDLNFFVLKVLESPEIVNNPWCYVTNVYCKNSLCFSVPKRKDIERRGDVCRLAIFVFFRKRERKNRTGKIRN